MEFRLIYDGLLLGASRNNTRAEHKQDIRRVFHKQLKHLWENNTHLKHRARVTKMEISGHTLEAGLTHLLGIKFKIGDFYCAPLVTAELDLACGLDILFLRYDQPGASLIQSGDIDNRIKTLFDALRRPQNTAEACGVPTPDEKPFFCLLEDDKLITTLSVTTDLLLEPNKNVNDVRLVVTVKIKPISVTLANIDFGF